MSNFSDHVSTNVSDPELDLTAFRANSGPFESDQVQSLSPEQIQQAAQLSQQVQGTARQWHLYLNALALFGFEDWLAWRDGSLNISRDNCSIFKPEVAQMIDAVCDLQVGQFRVCLLTTGKLMDDTVQIPRALLDLPEYAAHFYVLVEVQEEIETAIVYGFFSHQDWLTHQAQAHLQPEADWTYSVPLDWFDLDANRLLLYLRCLEVAAIPLPVAVNHQEILTELQPELVTALSQLNPQRTGESPQLWQVLTWEQGAAVLTQPQLLRWVYFKQNPVRVVRDIEAATLNPVAHLSDLLNLLTQPALNVGYWLQNELDDIATQLSWVLTPQLSWAGAMRSTATNLSPSEMRLTADHTADYLEVIQTLQNQGITIPPQTRLAYQDLQLDQVPLRLWVAAWALDFGAIPEWTLAVILRTPSGAALPSHLTFRISDAIAVLVEEQVTADEDYYCLFAQVSGGWDEKFIATIVLESGSSITLPPFAFSPV
ncbi:MAG: DUF1822 family protein [Microcoleaceae cyanobacterium]